MKIVSLSPAGTEIVAALGLRESLVGRSHNCDYPADVLDLPAMTENAITETSDAAIDKQVSQRAHAGDDSFTLRMDAIAEAQPGLIIARAMRDKNITWPANARVITLNPSTIEDILESILIIGEATNTTPAANELVKPLRERLDLVRNAVKDVAHRPTVAALEWLDPPFSAGHWVPQQIEIAGGRSALGEAGKTAQRIDWDEVIGSQAEVAVMMPCAKDIAGSVQAFIDVADLDVWRDLPATYLWQLYAVDASAYFSRPGPRVVDGVEILAGMIHPHLWPAPGPEQALRVNDVLQTQMRVDKNRRLRLE
jgi:iron complex transport system substrate-binding protein